MDKQDKYYPGISQSWMERASCLGLSFAFDKTAWAKGGVRKENLEQCRRVCENCPVRGQCLSWALDMDYRRVPVPQMAGGLTMRERQSLAR